MSKENYGNATQYESLIIFAYKCPRGMRNGAHLCFMENAMSAEEGQSYVKHLGSFEKQFSLVQKYLSKALLKLSKTPPYKKEEHFFLSNHARTLNSTTTGELMVIVNQSLESVLRLRVVK